MITEIKGNLFSTHAPIIMHGCNSKGRMGSGVALEIKKRYPKAYEVYREVFDKSGLPLGRIVDVYIEEEDKYIINAVTQKFYGYDRKLYTDYCALRMCLKHTAYFCKIHKLTTIAMPKIGCGLGGGDWDVVAEIISEEMSKLDVLVYSLI